MFKRTFRRLQGLYYFFDFSLVGNDHVFKFIHNFIIAKKQKNCNKSIDKRRKGVYDIRVIGIWWATALSIGKLNIGYAKNRLNYPTVA